MGVNSWMLRILVAVAVLAWQYADASAMSAFSGKYGMQCDGCHSRIPKLNDFGTAFLKNGFAIPAGMRPPVSTARRPEGEIEAALSIPAPREPLKPAAGDAPAGNIGGKTGSERAGEPVSEQASEEAPPPPPPMVLYKLKARDGSVYFTDNPRSAADLQEPAGSPARKTFTRTRGKAVLSTKTAARCPPAGVPDAAQVMEGAAPPSFRSYAECMEHRLVDAPQPGSAGEMMDLLTGAERACAAYSSVTR